MTIMPATEPAPPVYKIELPAGTKLLNANDRLHWRRQQPIKKNLRETACWLARAAKVPAMKRARMVGVFEPPNKRRRDPANWAPSWKAVVDGVVDAGVLPDDNSKYLEGPYPELGEVHPKGRLVLYIYDLSDTVSQT
ncbi:hypothetical protein [Nonomuraea candida]|uniref:hypothetical protein n=1 Tax=Nonomuraea candida TaxID=359159 RepID=UPI0006937EF4|nr:hypothetical protein [Nonomuraea candida]